jgi:glycyl-tRNA synthetase beta chain
MSELLLELFSEEIPARMQATAAADLQKLVVDGLKAQGLTVVAARNYVTPRRLTLVIEGVPPKSADVSEEKKGPRVGAPDMAIQGFLKTSGFKSLDEATLVQDAKKGDYYVAKIEKPGREAAAIIADVVIDVINKFPWPKSMRWGAAPDSGASNKAPDSGASNKAPDSGASNKAPLQWVRPLHSIICLLAGKVVPLTISGITSGNTTSGHRFLSPGTFAVTDFADYNAKLRAAHVALDPKDRATLIAEQAKAIAKSHKLALVEDEGLLNENAGLTEWPTVLMGTFDEAFLNVPAECLTTAMRAHQKCFSLKDPKTGKLANKFLLTSNLKAADEGTAIIHGNQKVIRARLSDAKFFWDQDLKRSLPTMAHELGGITFHEKLGSQADRVERITELARSIAKTIDAEPELAGRAAQLCKADLVSGTVGEFPELQGLMGRYLAEAGKENPKIAAAIEQHYKPKGAGDTVPRLHKGEGVSIAVALADKLDTLVGFWAINEKPTGSGDPYQLRRAALGVIRIVLENDLRLPLISVFKSAGIRYLGQFARKNVRATLDAIVQTQQAVEALDDTIVGWDEIRLAKEKSAVGEKSEDLLVFFIERLKVYLKDQGARHDLIDAVISLGGQDDLALIVKRVNALGTFLKTDDGANLLAGVKRAANIITSEEKKDKLTHAGTADAKLLTAPEELALHAAIQKVQADTSKAVDVENFGGAMRALAELRAPVDAFFEKVTVNDPDPAIRLNRLKLLSEIRLATAKIADFGKIGG